MYHGILLATLAGLGGMLGWGTADFFAKRSIDEIGDIVSLVWAHVAGAIILIAFVTIAFSTGRYTLSLPTSTFTWAGLAFFGALQAAVYLFVYIGFGKGQVSILNPVFASFSGFVALISIVFLGEAVTAIGVVADAGVLVASVIARVPRRDTTWLFLDAGVYNGLFEAMAYQGSTRYTVAALRPSNTSGEALFALAGPTGDSPDVITRETLLPADMDVGDKLIVRNAGAYSLSVTSEFNGFPKPPAYMV